MDAGLFLKKDSMENHKNLNSTLALFQLTTLFHVRAL